MLVKGQKFEIKWTKANRNWYINKGYIFTNYGDLFVVNAENLSIGCSKKVLVMCDYCNEIIQVRWKDYYNYKGDKYSCQKCRQIKTSEKNLNARQKSLYDRALEFCNSKGYILLTDIKDIKTSDTKVHYMCSKHGTHETKIYSLINKHGCPICQYEAAKLKPDDIERTFNMYHIKLLNKNDYIDYKTKNLNVVCPECGKVFITSYNSFITNHGQCCPSCSKSESVGERKIRKYLEKNKIKFIQEYTFDNCKDIKALPFDFYLPDCNKIIEYDGQLHYMPVNYNGTDGTKLYNYTLKHDNIKNNYCNNNGIKIIRIPYLEFNNIENILDKEFNSHEDIA